MDEISRRTAAKAIAWTAPAIAVAATVPQAAASAPTPGAPIATPIVLCCDPGYLQVAVTNPPSAPGTIAVYGWRDASGKPWDLDEARLLGRNDRESIDFDVEAADCDAPNGWVEWAPHPDGEKQYLWVDLSAVINPDCRAE